MAASEVRTEGRGGVAYLRMSGDELMLPGSEDKTSRVSQRAMPTWLMLPASGGAYASNVVDKSLGRFQRYEDEARAAQDCPAYFLVKDNPRTMQAALAYKDAPEFPNKPLFLDYTGSIEEIQDWINATKPRSDREKERVKALKERFVHFAHLIARLDSKSSSFPHPKLPQSDTDSVAKQALIRQKWGESILGGIKTLLCYPQLAHLVAEKQGVSANDPDIHLHILRFISTSEEIKTFKELIDRHGNTPLPFENMRDFIPPSLRIVLWMEFLGPAGVSQFQKLNNQSKEAGIEFLSQHQLSLVADKQKELWKQLFSSSYDLPHPKPDESVFSITHHNIFSVDGDDKALFQKSQSASTLSLYYPFNWMGDGMKLFLQSDPAELVKDDPEFFAVRYLPREFVQLELISKRKKQPLSFLLYHGEAGLKGEIEVASLHFGPKKEIFLIDPQMGMIRLDAIEKPYLDLAAFFAEAYPKHTQVALVPIS